MSEFTKQKWAVAFKDQGMGHGSYGVVIKNKDGSLTEVIGGLCESAAEEIVRRWNAFEPNGIVSELLKACEVAALAMTRELVNPDDIAFVEAAIANFKGSREKG